MLIMFGGCSASVAGAQMCVIFDFCFFIKVMSGVGRHLFWIAGHVVVVGVVYGQDRANIGQFSVLANSVWKIDLKSRV